MCLVVMLLTPALVCCLSFTEQDPLVQEGDDGDGRKSRHVRIIKYNIEKRIAVAQYIYELESLASINAKVPGQPFTELQQVGVLETPRICM